MSTTGATMTAAPRPAAQRQPRHAAVRHTCALILIALAAFLARQGLASSGLARQVTSYAVVQNDASLKIQGRTFRLFGAFIPERQVGCARADCRRAAVSALRSIIRGFVTCRPQTTYSDGSIAAFCSIDRGRALARPLDLGGWLIEQGLAVASPDAPFAYVTKERIAQSNGAGIWSGLRSPFP